MNAANFDRMIHKDIENDWIIFVFMDANTLQDKYSSNDQKMGTRIQ